MLKILPSSSAQTKKRLRPDRKVRTVGRFCRAVSPLQVGFVTSTGWVYHLNGTYQPFRYGASHWFDASVLPLPKPGPSALKLTSKLSINTISSVHHSAVRPFILPCRGACHLAEISTSLYFAGISLRSTTCCSGSVPVEESSGSPSGHSLYTTQFNGTCRDNSNG